VPGACLAAIICRLSTLRLFDLLSCHSAICMQYNLHEKKAASAHKVRMRAHARGRYTVLVHAVTSETCSSAHDWLLLVDVVLPPVLFTF
jgi:hypothetical protein